MRAKEDDAHAALSKFQNSLVACALLFIGAEGF